MKPFLVTGATQGLGLAIATALVKSGQRVVLAVRDEARGRAVAAALGERAEVRRVDLSRLADVEAFIASWSEPLAGLVNNAGLQQTDRLHTTEDGLEESFTVNHLAAFRLTSGLLPWLRGGRVVFIGSGTANPENRTATRFGFRGARFTSIEALARGDSDGHDDKQRGQDRYATGKWCNMVTTVEWTRRVDPAVTTFLCLDPGLMAGTGLARTAPAPLQLVWRSALKWVAPLMDDTSTPERSAAAAVQLLTAPAVVPGSIISFDGQPSRRVWPPTLDSSLGRRVFDETEAFFAARARGGVPAPSETPTGAPSLTVS
ncbi:MAG: SDR family NAD(P)-dependent oxidoreductase [Myxococcaceae bacterium]|nr:SDR family NAD(P)-dependent oxidoreductase [Myxococcaceae bacterium]